MEIIQKAYRMAVGYNSTVAAPRIFSPMPGHISAINEYTCTDGISVSMHINPPDPLPTKITTVPRKILMEKREKQGYYQFSNDYFCNELT